MGHNEKEISTKKLIIDTAITANASANINLTTNVAPAAVTTSTPSGWLPLTVKGVEYFIPLWT